MYPMSGDTQSFSVARLRATAAVAAPQPRRQRRTEDVEYSHTNRAADLPFTYGELRPGECRCRRSIGEDVQDADVLCRILSTHKREVIR